jgi:hypothetical protein
MTDHLIVFAKNPQPGNVKTRLTPLLSDVQAAQLAEAFLLDVLSMCAGLAGLWRTLQYAPVGCRARMLELAGPDWRVKLQRGNDLGERMEHALGVRLTGETTRAVIIGSDSPQIPPERILEAYEALEEHDMVLGPCDDGGFYLVGLRRWVPDIFAGVRWSCPETLSDTIRRADELGVSFTLLEGAYDIDDEAALQRLVGELKATPNGHLEQTRKALGEFGLV